MPVIYFFHEGSDSSIQLVATSNETQNSRKTETKTGRLDKTKCEYKLSIDPFNGQFYLSSLKRLLFAEKMLKRPCNR